MRFRPVSTTATMTLGASRIRSHAARALMSAPGTPPDWPRLLSAHWVLDVNNNKPTSQVLNIFKGYFGEYAGKYELISVAESVTQSERYSDWYDSDNNCNTQSGKDYSMIDHVLVTQGIQNKIDDVFFYHAYPEYCGTYNSDHYPVVIDFVDI